MAAKSIASYLAENGSVITPKSPSECIGENGKVDVARCGRLVLQEVDAVAQQQADLTSSIRRHMLESDSSSDDDDVGPKAKTETLRQSCVVAHR